MMSLSQTTGYAILALASLAEKENATGAVQKIARRAGVPAPYLAKIIRALAAGGLVTAKRGFHGGITLARPADKITILEISEAIDGPVFLNQCLLGLEACSDDRACPTHRFWKKERAQIRRNLRGISLADVVEFNRRKSARRRRA
jgi:Rrf2 family transcriptional regulator, iron-sulfur cluster assembly transcription factor